MRKLWLVTSLVSILLGLSACGGGGPSVTHLSVTIAGPVTAGNAVAVTISALTPAGNVATHYMGTVTITSSDPQAGLPGPVTLVNGTANVQVTLKTAGNQTIMASDSAHMLNGTGSVTVNAAQLSQLSVSSLPVSTMAGATFNVTVNAVDAFGNVIASYTGTVHFTSSDAHATLPADTKLQNGTGNVPITFKTAGAQTITVTDTANASLTGTSPGVNVNPGNAVQIAFTAPPAATTTVALMITVSAEDTYGNVAPT